MVAFEETPPRLHQDHENALWLAERLAELPGIRLNPNAIVTNIVIFDISQTGRSSAALSAEFKSRGLLINGVNDSSMRLVTHFDVSRRDCERALKIIQETVSRTTVSSAQMNA
jgi:threonine aldolase